MTKRVSFILIGLFAFALSGCVGLDGEDDGGEDGGVTRREVDVSGRIAVALGGSAPGGDEIVIDEAFTTLSFQNNDPDLFRLEVEDDRARVVPLDSGIGYVTPVINGRARDPIEVTIPPQKLVQILLGEARGELNREATTEGSGDEARVRLGSVSVTGDAVAAVIRNRIDLINDTGAPSLFLADKGDYESNPPLSYYDAVIEATNGIVFQFSPVKPGDASHGVYVDAEARDDVNEGLLVAYDQAVLTAAAVFNGVTEDPTFGAFSFYSPTADQQEKLDQALESGTMTMPAGCGASDANFPAFAPVQVLMLKDVAPSSVGAGVASFVFVRPRVSSEPAVTDEP